MRLVLLITLTSDGILRRWRKTSPRNAGMLETLGEVYGNDDKAREQAMTVGERLAYHQAHSGPLMEQLHQWGKAQLDEHKVEPNSGLGKAIRYFGARV